MYGRCLFNPTTGIIVLEYTCLTNIKPFPVKFKRYSQTCDRRSAWGKPKYGCSRQVTFHSRLAISGSITDCYVGDTIKLDFWSFIEQTQQYVYDYAYSCHKYMNISVSTRKYPTFEHTNILFLLKVAAVNSLRSNFGQEFVDCWPRYESGR